jgi:hypothetical protein
MVVSGFAEQVKNEQGSSVSVYPYHAQVSPFLVVFVDHLTKATSLWNAAIVLMIRYLNSPTSIPMPRFSELGEEFWRWLHDEDHHTYVFTGTT